MSNNEIEKEAQKVQAREEIKKAIRAKVEAAKKGEVTPNEEDIKSLEEMLKEAEMPVELKNDDFKLGPQELDLRGLNEKNTLQLFFRIFTIQSVYIRNVSKSLLDITNLLFVVLDALGVKNILKTSDDVLDKIAAENEKLQEIAKAVKEKKEKEKLN